MPGGGRADGTLLLDDKPDSRFRPIFLAPDRFKLWEMSQLGLQRDQPGEEILILRRLGGVPSEDAGRVIQFNLKVEFCYGFLPFNRRQFLGTAALGASAICRSRGRHAAFRRHSHRSRRPGRVRAAVPLGCRGTVRARSMPAASRRALSTGSRRHPTTISASSLPATGRDVRHPSPRASPSGFGESGRPRRRLRRRPGPARAGLRPPRTGRPRPALRRRCRCRPRRPHSHRRAARQHDPQRHPPLHQRHRRQALVQRPRNVAALSHHAGHPALQPLQPELRHRLRFPPQRDRRLLSLRLPVPARCSRLPRARTATARRRARPQSRNAEVHQRADRRPRHGVPTRPLDARLRVDQQPQSELHHRRAHRGQPRAVLPRCRARCC